MRIGPVVITEMPDNPEYSVCVGPPYTRRQLSMWCVWVRPNGSAFLSIAATNGKPLTMDLPASVSRKKPAVIR